MNITNSSYESDIYLWRNVVTIQLGQCHHDAMITMATLSTSTTLLLLLLLLCNLLRSPQAKIDANVATEGGWK